MSGRYIGPSAKVSKGAGATSPSSKGSVSPERFPDGMAGVVAGEIGRVESDKVIMGMRDDARGASSLSDRMMIRGDMIL